MPPASFEEILQKITGSTEFISLHVLGEPLLHPDLGLLLARCHDYGLRVNLTTNGTLLRQNQSKLLGQPALRQINISLHSFERPGREAVLDSYLAGIFTFIATALPASPVFINLRLWNMGLDESSLALRRLENHFGLTVPIPPDMPTGRGIILAPGIFLSREGRFTWPHGPGPDQGPHGYCRALRDHIAILADGTVVPCCLDAEGDMVLGNIFQATLPEILAGPRAAALREGFDRQRLVDPVCRRCTYRRRFGHIIPGRPDAGVLRGMSATNRDAA